MEPPVLASGIPPSPDFAAVARRYGSFERALSTGPSSAAVATVRAWDELRRELETWSSLTRLRFTQDTRNADLRSARERVDEWEAVQTGYDTSIKRRLAISDSRVALEAAFGRHVFRLWDTDLATYDPTIEADLVDEARLCAEYTTLTAQVEVDFNGERLNLSRLAAYATDPDRALRAGAAAARWNALGERGAELDGLFDRLVRLRHRIATKLRFPTFTELGYARMRRMDFDRHAVEAYRAAIAEHVVPLAQALAERARRRLGIEQFSLWDERFLADAAPPRPRGDAAGILRTVGDGLLELEPRLGTFARMMEARELTDLNARSGKAGGGYCTSFPTLGVPFVFANFNGSAGDVTVLTHELGHAFQSFSSRELPLFDMLWPTHEAAEVHSMSLEFLAWPLMERLFGDDADAYRENHLADSVFFLPYGVAVDHFQHLVYAQPEATPDERHRMWQWVERRYLPWRTYGDIARPRAGAFWQNQQHIYRAPFYYIDYPLALCCALQMWIAAQADPAATMKRYVGLCARGGEAPFRSLVADAGLIDPFDAKALPAVVAAARSLLQA